jgi:hypothetical protein
MDFLPPHSYQLVVSQLDEMGDSAADKKKGDLYPVVATVYLEDHEPALDLFQEFDKLNIDVTPVDKKRTTLTMRISAHSEYHDDEEDDDADPMTVDFNITSKTSPVVKFFNLAVKMKKFVWHLSMDSVDAKAFVDTTTGLVEKKVIMLRRIN